MTTIDLRAVRPGDYEYVIERVDEWWGGRSMKAMIPRLFFEHFPSMTIIAESSGRNGAPAGFLCGFQSEADPRCGYIHFVGVDPDLRGREIGRSLYQWFFARASALGCLHVQCVTSPMNTGSAAFHAAMGFTAELVENYDGPGESRLKLTRSIGLE